jgi:prepilin-type N-terminal cleavage/methylation domain-containing protein
VNARRIAHRVTPTARPGYTAIELIITLVIIGIIAAFAYPRVNFTQFQVDAAARQIRMVLQNAQRLAVTRQYDVVVSFDAVHSRVRTLEDNDNNNAYTAGERATWSTLEDSVHFATPPVGVNGGVGSGIVGATLATVDGMPSIIFRRDGAGNSDLEVYMTSKRASPNDWRGITVIQSTGRTDWFKYVGATWRPGNL